MILRKERYCKGCNKKFEINNWRNWYCSECKIPGFD